ncbi:MAG: sugar ABC transporter ATP-binding protein [Hyphomicrobiales bacterium]|nr:sugar ABC transporter ATP-binding protein [Hyphomicrobiales bacterium]
MSLAPARQSALSLSARGVAKRFGSTQALAHLDFDLAGGEIVGLMGANGAGKSTFVNILAGALHADSGELLLDGRAYRPEGPGGAIRSGVVAIHQATERAGASGLSVAEALLIDRFADGRSGFFVSPASIRRQAEQIAQASGFNLPLDADFGDIGPAERQLVAIARALAADARVLILDEPTASLSGDESERLFGVLEGLAARGLAILYISHRTQDLRRLAHRVVVLRGGRAVAAYQRPIDFSAALEAMIGRSLSGAHAAARVVEAEPRLVVAGLRLRRGAPPIDLSVRPGEVVAITGPLGAGKSRLLLSLFGVHPIVDGSVTLGGRRWAPRNPAEAIAAGVHMAGEDRRRTSFTPADWPGGTLSASIALPHLKRWFPSGFLNAAVERRHALDAIRRLDIRASGPDARLDTLSGGNQQKVVLARWQAAPPRLLLLDEPFQGVDVGARADIAAAVRAQSDVATLIATSDPEEALEIADRIFVLDRDGLRPLANADATSEVHP